MKILAIALALTMLLSVAATAGDNPAAKVCVHLEDHNAKRACPLPAFTACTDINTNYTAVAPYSQIDAIVVFYNVVGFAGAEFGLTWPAAWGTTSFTHCADFAIGAIVNPGDGLAITWTNCQPGYGVGVGYAWLYAYPTSPGYICPIPSPASGKLMVADCTVNANEDEVLCILCAGVGVIGDDPCEETATEASTWGGIKSMFK
jgi:hypothetical protein